MIELAIIVAATTLLTTIVMTYYAFFRQPNKLKKLNTEIIEAANTKQSLLQKVDSLSKENSQLQTDYNKLRNGNDKLQGERNKLTSSINVGQQELETINRDKQQVLSDLQTIKSEMEKLNATIENNTKNAKQITNELAILSEQKKRLQEGINILQNQVQQLKMAVAELSERKVDLEKENSELQVKVVQKKNSYRIKTYEFAEVPPIGKWKEIGYLPKNRFGKNCFPVVLMPAEKTRIKFPRKVAQHLQPTGYKEATFAAEIGNHLTRQIGIELYTNRILVISDKTLPYEPDFVLQDERENLNLFIDIEIDEPYDGVERFATHFKGKDDLRNQYFTDRGWIVIRFSERQVHLFPKECCRLIAEVIKDIAPQRFQIPASLSGVITVEEENFWTKVQAEKWAKENYREQYLNIPGFGIDNNKGIVISENIRQTEDEKEVEACVQTEIPFEKENTFGRWWNERNKHYRDSRIEFYPEPHLYIIDGNRGYTSATTLIYRFFEDFDADEKATIIENVKGIPKSETLNKWRTENTKAAKDGTQLHLDIENYFEFGEEKETTEFKHFVDFYKNYLAGAIPYRTEWRIFDDTRYVAGTADLVLKKLDGTYAIYDWKRSKEIKKFGFADFYTGETAKGFGICSDLEHANFYHYCIQLNIYKRILEEFYDKQVSEMYFVQLHPNFETYKLIKVEDMQDTVNEMFDTL